MLSPTRTLSSPCTSSILAPRPAKLHHHRHQPSAVHPPSLSLHRHHAPLHISTITIFRAKADGSSGDRDQDEVGEFLFGDGFNVADDCEMEDEEGEDDDVTESSVDLLLRFLQSMFKKLSKRAKKASRSVLPSAISPQLVSFAVDGILVLAALSIVKALLEVACTLGSTVFVVILLLRVIWAAISYFQSSGNTFSPGGGDSFASTQPLS